MGDLVRVAKEGSSFFGRLATVTERNWKQTGRVEVRMEPEPPQTRWTSMRSSFVGSTPNVLGSSRRPSAGSSQQAANNNNTAATSVRGSTSIASFASSVSSTSPVGAAITAPTPEELTKTYKPRELELVSRPDNRRPSRDFAAVAVAAAAAEDNRAKTTTVDDSIPNKNTEHQADGLKSLAAAVNNSSKSDNDDDEDEDDDDDDNEASSGDNSDEGVCFFGDVPGDSSQMAYGWPQDHRQKGVIGSTEDLDARKARRRSRRRKRKRSSARLSSNNKQTAESFQSERALDSGVGSGSSSDLSDAYSSAEDDNDEESQSSAAWAAREAEEAEDDAIASEDEVNLFALNQLSKAEKRS